MEYFTSEDNYKQLMNIYNALLTIETKGENTIVMSDCIRAMKNSLNNIVPDVKVHETAE